MDQRAGVWLVDEGGSSGSSAPAVPECVEESQPVKKHREDTRPVGVQCSELGVASVASDVAECISIMLVEERPRFQRLPLTSVTLVSKCIRDRWIGAAIVPTKGADEYAVAELKNDVMCSGFTEVLVRSDNEPAILVLKESAATALKLAGVTVTAEESALYDSQKQRTGLERCEGCEGCCENQSGLPRQTLWTGVSRRTPSPELACAVLRGDGEQVQERSRWQDSL